MPLIRLFTTIFTEKNDKRRSEYQQCLELNSANHLFDEICLLSEGGEEILPDNGIIKIRRVLNRPTYQKYFDWISELATDNDISIIANSDIFFDNQLTLFSHWKMPKEIVFALSRWDYGKNQEPRLYDHNDSQDAWILCGIPRDISGDFPVGVPRCDNRILFELQRAGYEVINPAFSVRAYHLHSGIRQEYNKENLGHFVEPPYAYLWPHNLWSLPRTLIHNLRHPDVRVSWCLDRRKLLKTLPVRAIRKVIASFRRGPD